MLKVIPRDVVFRLSSSLLLCFNAPFLHIYRTVVHRDQKTSPIAACRNQNASRFREQHPPVLLMLFGFAGAGKDQCGLHLAAYGFRRFAFADALKDEVADKYPAVDRAAMDTPEVKARVVDLGPNEGCKTIRSLLIGYGEMRRAQDINYWVDKVLLRMEHALKQHVMERCASGEPAGEAPLFVITDWRFSNEYERAKEWADLFRVTLCCRRINRGNLPSSVRRPSRGSSMTLTTVARSPPGADERRRFGPRLHSCCWVPRCSRIELFARHFIRSRRKCTSVIPTRLARTRWLFVRLYGCHRRKQSIGHRMLQKRVHARRQHATPACYAKVTSLSLVLFNAPWNEHPHRYWPDTADEYDKLTLTGAQNLVDISKSSNDTEQPFAYVRVDDWAQLERIL